MCIKPSDAARLRIKDTARSHPHGNARQKEEQGRAQLAVKGHGEVELPAPNLTNHFQHVAKRVLFRLVIQQHHIINQRMVFNCLADGGAHEHRDARGWICFFQKRDCPRRQNDISQVD